MRLTLFVLLALLVTSAVSSIAGEVRVIELTDGSIVTGEVQSLSNGVYTIKSDTLGTITISESKVRSIRQAGASGTAGGQDVAAQTQAIQQRMLSDKEVMSLISSLQNDPEFKKVLDDPAIMKAVQAGDVSSLMANQQFLKLLQNPTVQDIEKKMLK